MSYTPKHEPKAVEKDAAKPAAKAGNDKKKNQKIAIIVVLSVLAVIVVIALAVVLSGGKGNNNSTGLVASGSRHDVNVLPDGGKNVSDIEGLWSLDGATMYRFDGEGHGVLYTPAKKEFTFVYSAEDGILDMDFNNDEGQDPEYRYSINGDTLTLTRGTNTYNCTRVIE